MSLRSGQGQTPRKSCIKGYSLHLLYEINHSKTFPIHQESSEHYNLKDSQKLQNSEKQASQDNNPVKERYHPSINYQKAQGISTACGDCADS